MRAREYRQAMGGERLIDAEESASCWACHHTATTRRSLMLRWD